MGYEDSPACEMLATNCAVCGRPLVDAVSVQTGIGPDCRGKHGFNIECDEMARFSANSSVYRIALNRSNLAIVNEECKRLNSLGFDKLAGVILDRLSTVKITKDPATFTLAVETPYNDALVAAMRGINGRRWDKVRKLNTFPVSARPALWTLLQRFFPGHLGLGPNGAFIIPG